MIRSIWLVVLAGVGLAFAASAHGSTTAERNLAAALPIARAAWPDSPCAGRENVQITNTLKNRNAEAEAEMDGSCVVRIRPMKSPYKFCVDLVHEVGHLDETVDDQGIIHLPGHEVDTNGHTRDGGIMDEGGGFWQPCEKLGPLVTPREAAASIFDIPASWCRLTGISERPRGHVYRCGRTRRVLVVLTADGDVDYVTDPPRVKRSRCGAAASMR